MELIGEVAQRADLPRSEETMRRAIDAMSGIGEFDPHRVRYKETVAAPQMGEAVVVHRYSVDAMPPNAPDIREGRDR